MVIVVDAFGWCLRVSWLRFYSLFSYLLSCRQCPCSKRIEQWVTFFVSRGESLSFSSVATFITSNYTSSGANRDYFLMISPSISDVIQIILGMLLHLMTKKNRWRKDPKRIARSAIFIQSKSLGYPRQWNNESWAQLFKCDYKFCFV